MRKLQIKPLIFTILISTVFFGCVSMMEKTGRLLDGTTSSEKIIETYKNETSDITVFVAVNKNQEQSIIIALRKFPMMKLRGSFPDENGGFFLTSLDYLAGNTHGWNEYSLQLLGEGNFSNIDPAVLKIGEIESIQITYAKIHRYDNRITGNDALVALRNRRERITALVEWMLTHDTPEIRSLGHFNNYWKPIIFPENVSKKNKPANWKLDDDTFQKAEDIRWNTGYTKRNFPEELWPIRDSGTLLRDWEEALSWIYMEYEWINIMELLTNANTLYKN